MSSSLAAMPADKSRNWRDRARALGPMLDAAAAADEEARELPAEVVEAIDRAGLFEIMVPTVVVCGDRDQTTSRWHSEQLGVRIPEARNVWVEGKGHLLNWEAPESLVAAVRSATLRMALRARGFLVVSREDARCARPTILSSGCGISLARKGKRRGTSGRASPWKKRFTSRSSSEWKLMTARRPPAARRETACGSISDTSSSSRLT